MHCQAKGTQQASALSIQCLDLKGVLNSVAVVQKGRQQLVDILLTGWWMASIAEVQPRLIQGIRRGDGVGDYLHIHQRYKE